jgi:glutathione S-transferase
MKLYYAPGTCALACWMALEWAGADFEVEKANPHAADFLRINPLAQVPALDLGEDRARTQAGAILEWIAGRFPDADLGPGAGADDEARFRFHETMAFLTGDFHPAFWPWFVPQRYTTDPSEAAKDAARAAAVPRIDRVMTYLDGLIGDTDHVFGDKRTVADAYAFVMARWTGRLDKTWRDYPNIARFITAMETDAAVQKVLAASAA